MMNIKNIKFEVWFDPPTPTPTPIPPPPPPTHKQGKSEGFDNCDRPSNLTQIRFKSSILKPVWPWNLMDDPEK